MLKVPHSNIEALRVFCHIRNCSFWEKDKSQIKGTLLQKTDLPWQRSYLKGLQGCIFLLWPLLVRMGSRVEVSDSHCCSYLDPWLQCQEGTVWSQGSCPVTPSSLFRAWHCTQLPLACDSHEFLEKLRCAKAFCFLSLAFKDWLAKENTSVIWKKVVLLCK